MAFATGSSLMRFINEARSMLVVVVTKSSKKVTSVLVCSFEKVPLFRELFVQRDGGDFNSSSRVTELYLRCT